MSRRRLLQGAALAVLALAASTGETLAKPKAPPLIDISKIPVMQTMPESPPAEEDYPDNRFEAVADGFEKIYKRADATGLKLPVEPVDASFLTVEVPGPLPRRPDADYDRFIKTSPPQLPGLDPSPERLVAWGDYLRAKIEDLANVKDRAGQRKLAADLLLVEEINADSANFYGTTSDGYIGALGLYLATVDAEVDLTETEQFALLAGDPATEAAVRKRLSAARAALPADDRSILLKGDAKLLAILTSLRPLEKMDLEFLTRHEDMLRIAGRSAEADRIAGLAAAVTRNGAISQYNAMIDYRQQNIEINNFDSAVTWDISGLKALGEALGKEAAIKDPLVLRYALLVAADGFAAGDALLADQLTAGGIMIARKACEVQACGDLTGTAGFKEGLALLDGANLPAASAAYRAAVAGGKAPAPDPVNEKLAALKIELFQCYGKADVITLGSGLPQLTARGARDVARCDASLGGQMMALRKARGETAEKPGEYRDLLREVADASQVLGQHEQTVAAYAELLAIDEKGEPNYIALSIDTSALAGAQIALGRLADADATLAKKRAINERLYAEGYLFPNEYDAENKGIQYLTIERLLADPARAGEAFDPALAGAQEERTFREGLGGTVREETQLARSAGYANRFTTLLDAAWARQAKGGDLLEAAVTAAQDATLDPTSLSLAMSVAADPATTDPALAALVGRRRELLDKLAPYYGVDQKTPDFDLSVRSGVAQREGAAQAQKDLAEFEQVTAELRTRFPDYFALIRPRALGIAEARALLKPDEAALLIVPTERGTHSIVVTSEGAHWVRADLTADQLGQDVRRLLWFAGGSVGPTAAEQAEWADAVDGGESGFDRDTAFALYGKLIAPHEAQLGGKTKLLVSASGALGAMPLAMLVTAAPQGADDDPAALRGTSWLADRFTLAELPSLQSLAFLRKFKAKPGQRKGAFIGIGDPALAGPAQDTGSRRGAVRGVPVADLYEKDPGGGKATLDVERLRKLPSLPGTGRELKAMASALSLGDDALRLRESASESTIKSLDLSGYGVVTFATHGLLAGELGPGQEPGLVFTPPAEASANDNGLLTPEEVARLKLSADWVILSACNTAGGDGSDGAPALSGLARSFFYAGARSLLVSHWPVRDDVAAKMTVRALQIRSLDPDVSRAEAFQRAQREIRKSPVADGVVTTSDGGRYENSWAHPNAWAPFVLIGDVSE